MTSHSQNDTNRPALQEKTLGAILDDTIEKYPDNEAVVYIDRDFRLIYRGFGDIVDQDVIIAVREINIGGLPSGNQT